jgi:hypothetical protein
MDLDTAGFAVSLLPGADSYRLRAGKNTYMENYLCEFCYKFNRRYLGISLFDRIGVATLSNPWDAPIPNSG